MSWTSSFRVLKRAVRRSLRRLVESRRMPPFLPDETGAVRPPDQPLEMPGISTGEGVNRQMINGEA